MAIQSTAVMAAGSTIYTSTGNSAVTVIYFCNNNATAVTANIHLVPNGLSVNSNNIIYNTLDIASKDTYVLDTEKLIFDNGDQIVVVASADNSLVATLTYVGI